VNRKSPKKNRWEDHYTRKARKDKYPARSVYKLQEIQKKFRVINKGDRVLDLGCAPGIDKNKKKKVIHHYNHTDEGDGCDQSPEGLFTDSAEILL